MSPTMQFGFYVLGVLCGACLLGALWLSVKDLRTREDALDELIAEDEENAKAAAAEVMRALRRKQADEHEDGLLP